MTDVLFELNQMQNNIYVASLNQDFKMQEDIKY